ncbi:hypothetical protein CEP54_000314 [Fusarium duplospermum]|uniref:Uncharacterized protein n=1 Tax=Fusarium duplospermum TaxID=1325734 RepID=A0A428R741_9HYPO|nr:hypothetical protein CEP54_000314 [Fusarium duplospermum]
MDSHDRESDTFVNSFPCLGCLRQEVRQVNKAIADAEATGAASPVAWSSIECTYADLNQAQCDLCKAEGNICQPTLAMIHGNVKSMIATISYISGLLERQDPSPAAVVEQGDEFPHVFPRATRAGIVKALAKLGEAFDTMVTSHQREHGLLGSFGQDAMQSHEQTYQVNVAARLDNIIQSGLLFWSPGGTLRLQSSDAGFADWNIAVQEFYRDVTRVMEETNMAQAAIHITLTNLPI